MTKDIARAAVSFATTLSGSREAYGWFARRRDKHLVPLLTKTFAEVFPADEPLAMTSAYFTHLHNVQFLHRRLIAMRPKQLRSFVKERVRWSPSAAAALSHEPLVACGPHWGFYTLAALKLAERFGSRLLIFYNPPELNPFSATMTTLLERLDSGAGAVLNDRRGVLRAFRHVKEGGVVAIMPDFASPSTNSLFVPFFGRFFEALPGAATMSRKNGAPISTIYCRDDEHDRYTVAARMVAPSSPGIDDTDAAYRVTAALFEDMEAVMRPSPHLWTFWDTYSSRCLTGVRVPRTLDEARDVLQVTEHAALRFGADQQAVLRQVLPQLAVAAGSAAMQS